MPKSARSRLLRARLNRFPAYRATGARITYVAEDLGEVRIKLPLNRRTRNYVGTLFGGAMYAAVDPIYMVMLIERLGRDYLVWDKAAWIRFKRPGRDTLYARFVLDEEVLDEIRRELTRVPRLDREFEVDLVDAEGTVHATARKTIHIRRRETTD